MVSQQALKYIARAQRVPTYLREYADVLKSNEIQKIRMERAAHLAQWQCKPIFEALDRLPSDMKPSFCDFTQSVVRIGNKEDLDEQTSALVLDTLKTLMPWKKGPFAIFGHEIDAEWRSDMKWDRLSGFLGPLKGKRVCDIGCNNGYYMLRMLPYEPELIVGLEPYVKYWYNFNMMADLAAVKNIELELFGVEQLDLYPKFFDVILCLGILYHHTDPVGLLQKMRRSLRYGGKLIIDCQGIAGDDELALVPARRYAGARGIWFLPTYNCLKNWILRADFKVITPIFNGPLLPNEQRRTEWAPIKSLAEFLDPNDPTRTIEGYPAPRRFYLMAKG